MSLAILPAFIGNDVILSLDKDVVSKIVPVHQGSFVATFIYYIAGFKTVAEECKDTLLRQQMINPTCTTYSKSRNSSTGII